MTDALPSDRPPTPVQFKRALRRMAGLIRRTPLVRCPDLSEALGRPVWIKHEELQRTGSFKIRGAANFLTRLAAEPDPDRDGVVACSSGNHGRAVAEIARDLGVRATICVPAWVDPIKLAGIRRAGADVRADGSTYDEAEALAVELARNDGLRFVPPFDHRWIVEGQGTLAIEVVEQLYGMETIDSEQSNEGPRADPGGLDLVVPLSGGGLAAGCTLALDHGRVLAVSAERAPVMLRSLRAGSPLSDVEERSTLASALSGGIGNPNRVTFPLLRDATAGGRAVLLEASESAIHRAVRYAAVHLHAVVEGGGATGLATFLEWDEPRMPSGIGSGNSPLVIVLSGGNLDPDLLLGLVS